MNLFVDFGKQFIPVNYVLYLHQANSSEDLAKNNNENIYLPVIVWSIVLVRVLVYSWFPLRNPNIFNAETKVGKIYISESGSLTHS